MDRPLESVVIAGGGSAGWMTAALFSKLLEGRYAITLVESDEISTVGVGEATIPAIKRFNSLLELDETDFLLRTRATFKLGIEFRDWGRIGDRYVHGFGRIGRDFGWLRCHQYWLKMFKLGKVPSLDHFSINTLAARDARFMSGAKNMPDSPLSEIAYAYHFDAGLYAAYLRAYAEQRGVRRLEGKIVDVVQRGDNGFIESLMLDDGARVEGDLFIDCTGFRSLLIGQALGNDYESWSQWLPCDRAIAVPTGKLPRIESCTRSTAREAGWQWRIPLQHRIGNGLVYASAHLGDSEAEASLLSNLDAEPIAEPLHIRFLPGKRKKTWSHNCIAVGLAAGFLEPLESTSLHMIQSAAVRLLGLFPDRGFDPANIDEYNRQTDFEFTRVRDFIILHYKANERTDSDFWANAREMPVPDSLARKLELFARRGRFFREADELFAEESWIQVMLGQHVVPETYDPLVDLKTPEEICDYLDDIQSVIARCVEAMPDHARFIEALKAKASARTAA